MTLSISVQFASAAKHLPSRAQVRRWALAAHRHLPAGIRGTVAVVYAETAMAREMNAHFRGRDYATNVLTFAYKPLPVAAREADRRSKKIADAHYAADIVICAPVIAREAREQKKAVHDHHAHMVVHGMLHAQGFDHEDATEAAAMEAIEIAVLKRFRIKNPYETE